MKRVPGQVTAGVVGATLVASSFVVLSAVAFSVPVVLLGVLLGAFGLALAVRTLFIGIYRSDSELVVRDWLRTRHIARSEVSGVSTAAYDGVLQRGTRSRQLSMLEISSGDGRLPIYATVGYWRNVRRKRDRLRRELGISTPSN